MTTTQSKGKTPFVPKPFVLTVSLAERLNLKLSNDIQQGYFNNYPNVEKIIIDIKHKTVDTLLSNTERELTSLEVITLKANDYIRDKHFKLPLWYHESNN